MFLIVIGIVFNPDLIVLIVILIVFNLEFIVFRQWEDNTHTYEINPIITNRNYGQKTDISIEIAYFECEIPICLSAVIFPRGTSALCI